MDAGGEELGNYNENNDDISDEELRHPNKRRRTDMLYSIVQPTITKDPKQFHKLMEVEKMQETSILSLTVSNKKDKMIYTFAAALDLSRTPEEWDSETLKNLFLIFKFLHPALIREDDPGDNNLEVYLDQKREMNVTATQDYSVLHRCIHAFATQSLIGEEPNITFKWRSQRAASFASTDIIRNLKSQKVGRLQMFIAKQLVANGATQGLRRICNKFGLSVSLEKERLASIKDVHSALMLGLPKIDPHDLWLLLYDNIGFKIKKGYDQYTAMQWVRVSKEKMIEWQLYPKFGETMSDHPFPIGHPYRLLSYSDLRKRIKWTDVREQTDFDKVLGITSSDTNRVADSVFGLINSLLSIFNKLPTLTEAIELLAKGQERNTWEREYEAQEDHRQGSNDDGGGCQTSESVILTESLATNYKANDAYIDAPMKKDLNAKSTVRSLMDYGVKMRDRVLEKEAQGRWASIPKILEDIPLPLCGDGNPTYLISTILREEHESYDRKVEGHNGGFHLGLEAHRKRGDAFAASHLEDFFSCWRESEGQLRWVMNPGDPNQISAELAMYVLGIYAAAIHSHLSIKAASEEDESINACASDIVDLMIERAREWPIVMVILVELRFAELTFMLDEAEKDGGDIDLFVTVHKYFSRLFASTHCTKYVSMMTDFFVKWHCYSPAERIIYSKAVFTRKTRNGKSIYTVRWLGC